MSDFSPHTRARCPRCKTVFSLSDGVPCECFDDYLDADIDDDQQNEEWRDNQ